MQRQSGEPQTVMVVYCYDGSFEGLLCCVFESYDNKEMPADVLPEDGQLPLLLNMRMVQTRTDRAERVLKSIPQKMGYAALDFVRRAFLTNLPGKELLILKFLRLGFRHGHSLLNRLTDETVHALIVAVRHLNHEAHLFQGFVRFSETNGVLTAQIEPKNIVLPLLAQPFAERYPGERFLIYDKTHGMVLLHQDHKIHICGTETFEQPQPDEEELKFRELWRLFYKTIEIKERHNPRCRMSHMPKRYWNCMTEFAQQERAGQSPALPAAPVIDAL